MGWVPYPPHMGPRFAGPIIGAHRAPLKKKKYMCLCAHMGHLGNLGQHICQSRCEHADRFGLVVPANNVSLTPIPLPQIRCWVLTLLTKCGVVVGVFGLGPKGRGLDSLYCVGCPCAGGWLPYRVRKELFCFSQWVPVRVPIWVPRMGCPLRPTKCGRWEHMVRTRRK